MKVWLEFLRYWIVAIVLVAQLIGLPREASSAVYYVTSTGSDINSGSLSSPWRTLQRAVNAAIPGDNVIVSDGTYAGFYSVNSGTLADPITIKAAGNNVIIKTTNGRTSDIINIENTDYIVVDGFNVSGGARAGIRVAAARGVVLKNNRVGPNTIWGIFTGFTPEIKIINNVTFDSIQQHGIYVSNSTVLNDTPVIRGNESYGNYQNGIQVNGDCSSGGDGVITGAIVENNKVYNNGWKGLSLISMADSSVENNLLFNNGTRGAGAGGIHFADQPGCNLPSSRNTVANNTVVEPRIAGIRISNSSTENVLFNNLVVSGSAIVDEVGGNAIDSISNVTRSTSAGIFVDTASANYHLATGSPAIDAGRATYLSKSAPRVDLDGNLRPLGTAYDSGVYEYGGSREVPYPPSNLRIN